MSPRLRAQSLQLLNNRTGDIHALVRIRQQPPEKAGEDREANELREELANVGLAQSHHAECPDHRNHNQRPEQTRCSGLNSWPPRSEEHTSELQSRGHLVCRLLLEK